MGRSAKRYISIITVLMVMCIPISTAFAAVDSLFTSNTESLIVDIASDYQNIHDTLIFFEDNLTVVDESVVHALLFSDTSHDNQGSGGVNVTLFAQAATDRINWNYTYIYDNSRHELTSVSLPADIRPPIYF